MSDKGRAEVGYPGDDPVSVFQAMRVWVRIMRAISSIIPWSSADNPYHPISRAAFGMTLLDADTPTPAIRAVGMSSVVPRSSLNIPMPAGAKPPRVPLRELPLTAIHLASLIIALEQGRVILLPTVDGPRQLARPTRAMLSPRDIATLYRGTGAATQE